MIDRGSTELGDQVDGERDRGDVEADRIVVEVGQPRARPGGSATAERHPSGSGLSRSAAVISCAVAAGATSSANTSSAPVICAVAATVSPSASMNASEILRNRHAAGVRDRLVHGGEKQRPTDDREERQCDYADDGEREHLPAGDSEEVPEQQILHSRRARPGRG